MMTKRSVIALIAGGVALASAIIPLFPTDFWAIRATGFVREPAGYLFIILAIVVALFVKRYRLVSAAMFVGAAAINFIAVWPYTALAPTQVDLASSYSDEQCFTAYSANVKMQNTQYGKMIDQIEELQPDILFLTEVDQGWADALGPTLSDYPYALSHPRANTFGKVFASRLPVAEADILERADENTPSIFAVLEPSEGFKVQFIGLHPKAPLPGQSTGQRDESIKRAADRTIADISGAIAMGDFNDVPWSSTTTAFREMGEWEDPRIGRGTYATFPAFAPALGWPLDQIMVRDAVKVRRFEVLDANGSDHRALLGELCVDKAVTRTE